MQKNNNEPLQAREPGRPELPELEVPKDYARVFLDRTSRILAPEMLSLLRNSTLLIAGCGGVGGAVALTLARMGVGHIILCDPGRFDPPDVNRQWAADLSTLGMNKASVYGDWLKRINPEIAVEVHTEGLQESNVDELTRRAQVVIDCLDVSVPLALRARMFRLARAQGHWSISAPVFGFGTLVAVAAPDGVSMDAYIDFIEAAVRDRRFPPAFYDLFLPASMEAFERFLHTGTGPSLAIGPVLAGALASTEALLALLDLDGKAWRKPLCMPQILMVDAVTMQYRVAPIGILKTT